ncbi:MAG: efflux RND transporter periplasmic adaptor subunit, partial [Chloroflexi bacterium]|nr:efflux RND transporter periplasmic adaptor subunit [Chloroflexota bacterium]
MLLKDPRKRWWVIVPGILILAAIGGLSYYGLVLSPAQQAAAAAQPVMQTAVVRRGNITLSASGTGTLVAANQVNLGFGTSGQLITLNVKVGDQVKHGQLLAAVDNTSQALQLLQAKRALANLTSDTSIATAQEAVATANKTVYSTKNQLIYLISPQVFYDEQQIAAAQQALDQAKSAANNPPTSDQQKAIDAAATKLTSDQHQLAGDQLWYTQAYVPNIFITRGTVNAPTDSDIAGAKAAYAAALASVQEAQWYVDALTGVAVPDNATGINLSTFEQAKLTLQSAQDTFNATQLYAPFSGIVTTVSAQLGDSVGSTAIITVADMSTLYVQTYIDQSSFAMFQVGNAADVIFDALPNLTLKGKVVQVSPALVTSSGQSAVSGMVQLDPTSTNLLLGMSAAVNVIAGDAQNAVLAPVAALHETTPGQYAVFVVKNGQLTLTDVTVGLQDPVNAEIKSGLQ